MGDHPLLLNRNTADARPKDGKTRNSYAKMIGRGWWLRSAAGGRSGGKARCIDSRTAQVSDNGRRRRAQENMDRYPRREAVERGRKHMGPFCVCVEGAGGTGSFRS